MLYSEKLEMERMAVVKNENLKVLEDCLHTLKIPVSNELKEYVEQVGKRIGSVRFVTYEEFDDMFPAEAVTSLRASKVKMGDPKKFPILYLYDPELVPALRKINNWKEVMNLLPETLKKGENTALESFVKEVLPSEIPDTIRFYGSRERVMSFTSYPDTKLFGDTESSVFATVSEKVLAIFYEKINPKEQFKWYLVKNGTKSQVAQLIAENIDLSHKYSLHLYEVIDDFVAVGKYYPIGTTSTVDVVSGQPIEIKQSGLLRYLNAESEAAAAVVNTQVKDGFTRYHLHIYMP